MPNATPRSTNPSAPQSSNPVPVIKRVNDDKYRELVRNEDTLTAKQLNLKDQIQKIGAEIRRGYTLKTVDGQTPIRNHEKKERVYLSTLEIEGKRLEKLRLQGTLVETTFELHDVRKKIRGMQKSMKKESRLDKQISVQIRRAELNRDKFITVTCATLVKAESSGEANDIAEARKNHSENSEAAITRLINVLKNVKPALYEVYKRRPKLQAALSSAFFATAK